MIPIYRDLLIMITANDASRRTRQQPEIPVKRTSNLLYSTMIIRPEHCSVTSKQEACTGDMQVI